MINKIIKSTVALSLVATVAFGADGARFNVINGDATEKYAHLMGSIEDSIGFSVSKNENINDAYAKKYGDKAGPNYDKDWAITLDSLGFYSMSNDAKLNPILKTNPEVAGFAPFNLLAYKKVNDDRTFIGHVSPKTMLDIVGTKDAAVRKDFIAMFDPLDKWIQDNLGGKVEIKTFKSLPAKPMMNFEIPFDRPEDLSEFVEEFQENFEASFEDRKYIIAGYKDFKESYADLEIPFEEYDAFFVYSLCHFTFSYNVFNKGRPDNGVFAPCSMYMYIKKDSNTIVVGMPTLANWVSVMNITDPTKIEWTKKIDAEIISIMKEFGAKEI